MKEKTFAELNLVAPIVRALSAKKYERPTPIQSEAIPPLMDGRDLIGCAQTGTGKTAAFALPILQKLFTEPKSVPSRRTRVLVLTPTRELAAQVGESFKTYGRYLKLTHALVFGGVGQYPQVKALRRGVDILVATPGRLLDLMEQGHATLNGVETFVLDEADRMLDMGFLPDIKKIIAGLPRQRQTLLFSATMPPAILKLAEGILSDPIKVAVSPPATVAPRIDERVLFVDERNKRALLGEILKAPETDRALVFTRTKHGAKRLVTQLEKTSVKARAIHGNKSQTARMAALEDFRRGRCQVLVATDIASRGIDVVGISHVINYDFPNEPESYIHRIGRTARSGAAGIAISFCGTGERLYLRDIERLLKRRLPIDENHSYHSASAAHLNKPSRGRSRPGRAGKGRSRHRRGTGGSQDRLFDSLTPGR
jgi:ATP-dependent RNA helicase RhlE